jgi:predicted site-specific integrase-resolvase
MGDICSNRGVRPKATYTRRELAELLGLNHKTLARWACCGLGPVFHKRGRRVRYRAADVAAWLDDPGDYRAGDIAKKT